MAQPMSIITSMLWLLGDIVFFVTALLLLRYAAKLKWLTAICLSVIAATFFSILVIRIMPGPVRMGIGIGFLLPAAVCSVILIIQLFRWVISSSDNAIVNTAERDRILKMVEKGKINTEEGTELLDAMGRSSALRGEEKFRRVDMVMLIGVSLVILGFFLPWVYIPMQQVPGPFRQFSAYQAGYHTGPMGWAVLFIVIASAIPIFVTPKDFLYKVSMMQIFLILIGAVLVISLLVRAGTHLGAGLMFCITGFLVELFGCGVKFKKLAA
jgi:hypothetical protein